jgi:glutathione transport system permease protein
MPVMQTGTTHAVARVLAAFRQQPMAMASGIFVLLLIVVAVVAPWIAPFDAENYFDYDRLNEGPSLIHWFGVIRWAAISSAGCWSGRKSR